MMTTLTVSIVNHNSIDPLHKCLESVLANVKNLTCQIHVVDNLCEEQAAAMISKEFPQVKVLSNTQTLGFGANHNQILRSAIDCSRYILVLNPDVVLPPDTLSQMLDVMDEHEAVAVCSPTIVDDNGQPWVFPSQVVKLYRDAVLLAFYISDAQKLPGWFERLRNLKVSRASSTTKPINAKPENLLSPPSDIQFREVILGACMLFRAEALQEIGLFDEQFFLYREDFDWCLRATKLGWKVMMLNNIKVSHMGGYSTHRQDYLKYFLIRIQSMLLFYRKYSGGRSELALRIWLTLVATFNILRWSIISAIQPGKKPKLAPWRVFSMNLIKGMWSRKPS